MFRLWWAAFWKINCIGRGDEACVYAEKGKRVIWHDLEKVCGHAGRGKKVSWHDCGVDCGHARKGKRLVWHDLEEVCGHAEKGKRVVWHDLEEVCGHARKAKRVIWHDCGWKRQRKKGNRAKYVAFKAGKKLKRQRKSENCLELVASCLSIAT